MARSHRESAAKALQDVDKKSAPAKAAFSTGKGEAHDEEKALLPQGSGSPS